MADAALDAVTILAGLFAEVALAMLALEVAAEAEEAVDDVVHITKSCTHRSASDCNAYRCCSLVNRFGTVCKKNCKHFLAELNNNNNSKRGNMIILHKKVM